MNWADGPYGDTDDGSDDRSTIEWSALPFTVVPPLIRHHLPPGTDVVRTVALNRAVIDGTLVQARIWRISPSSVSLALRLESYERAESAGMHRKASLCVASC